MQTTPKGPNLVVQTAFCEQKLRFRNNLIFKILY